MKSSVLAVAMYLGSTHARVGQGIIKPQKEQLDLGPIPPAGDYGALKTTYSVKKNPNSDRRASKRLGMGDLEPNDTLGTGAECVTSLKKTADEKVEDEEYGTRLPNLRPLSVPGRGGITARKLKCVLKNPEPGISCKEVLDSDGLVASCEMIIGEEQDSFFYQAGLDTIQTVTPQQQVANKKRGGNWDFMGKGMRRHDAPSQAKQYSSIEAAKAGFDAEQDSKSEPVTDSESEGSDSE